MKLPVIDKLQRFDKRILAWDGPPIECPTKISSTLSSIVLPGGESAIRCSTTIGSTTSGARSHAWTTFSAAKPALQSPHMIWSKIIRVTKGRKPVRDEELEKTGTVLPTTIPDIEYGRGEIEKQITERTRQKIADFGIELLDERFKRSKYNPAVAEKIIERMSSERHQIAARIPFRRPRRSGEH